MMEPTPLRNAATVILLREGDGGMPEIFFLRRNRNQTFMGDAYVFPGGAVDDADADPELAAHIMGPGPSEAAGHLQEPDLPANLAQALYMAAIRETFEETGVLLAYDEQGRILQFEDPGSITRYTAARRAIYRKESTMGELARAERVRYAFDLLVPYAHWITPVVERKRFDTRFFLARLPRSQEPHHDGVEATDSCWLSPADALDRHREGGILLMPPTLKTVEELGHYGKTAAIFQEAATRRIYPIRPHAVKTADAYVLLLPHDPDYPAGRYRQPPNPSDPSRVILKKGSPWRTGSAD